jgi:hypothetical protein
VRILRGLTSRVLPCGCVAGVYETYDGEVVTLLDERDATCQIDTHENGNRIPVSDSVRASSKVAFYTEGQG